MNRVLSQRTAERGFTLLEMVLALGIGLVLMTALYMAMNTQLQHAQAGREVVEEGVLARSILTRIAADITSNLGPVDPRQLPEGAQPQEAETTASSDSGSGTNTNETGNGTTSGSSGGRTMNSVVESGAGPFNLMVLGDSSRLILSTSRVPRELYRAAAGRERPAVSDLCRVTYWLVGSGEQVVGLAKQQLSRVTSAEADHVPPDVADPESYVVAREVKSLSFEYFDGTSWQSTWDGMSPGEDGTTPIGPPAAIAITITVEHPGRQLGEDMERRANTYRHVVAIPTANSFVPPEAGTGP